MLHQVDDDAVGGRVRQQHQLGQVLPEERASFLVDERLDEGHGVRGDDHREELQHGVGHESILVLRHGQLHDVDELAGLDRLDEGRGELRDEHGPENLLELVQEHAVEDEFLALVELGEEGNEVGPVVLEQGLEDELVVLRDHLVEHDVGGVLHVEVVGHDALLEVGEAVV